MDVGAWRRRMAARGLFVSRNDKGVACRPSKPLSSDSVSHYGQKREADSSLRNREVKPRRRKLERVESDREPEEPHKGYENWALALVRMAAR